MDEARLIERLSELDPPDLDGPRSRAVVAARVRLNGAGRPAAEPRSRWRARALRTATVCLAIVAAAAFTPPGRSAVAWVGDQIGIGQPGGPASLGELREFALEPSGESDTPAYVVARGPVRETGGHYEIVSRYSQRERAHCYELQLVKPASLYGPACTPSPGETDMTVDSLGSSSEVQTLSGRVGPRIDAVRVEFDDRPIPVQVTEVDEHLLAPLGIDGPLKFYFASMPFSPSGGRLEIVALDRDGRAVGEKVRKLPDRRAGIRMMCEQIRRSIARTGRGRVDPRMCPT